MIALNQSRTKRLVAIHGWSGTILGILLYVVVFTGAVVVFDNEIGVWSQNGATGDRALSELIDRPVRQLAREVDPRFYEEVTVGKNSNGQLRVSFLRHQKNPATGELEDYGIIFLKDLETGEMVDRYEGYLRENVQSQRGHALQRFFVDLHVQLYMPEPWGLYATGVLGLMMMFSVISGVLMHRHVIRDMYLPARDSIRLSSARDRHVLISAWSVPFGILLAFTGAFFSFAISLGVPVLAMVAFGGDQQALIESVIGLPEAVDNTPMPFASLDYVIADAAARAGTVPTFLLFENFGTASASLTTFHGAAPGDLTGMRLGYDGVTREFMGAKPQLGQVPSVGSSIASLMGPLHFGNFAGVTSRIVWLALGAAMAYATATGLLLWVRRRAEDQTWQKFNRSLVISLWGLPIAMMGSAVAFFLTLPAGDPVWWTPAAFVITSLVVISMGLGKTDPSARYRWMLAGLCFVTPLLRMMTGGTSWSEALMTGTGEVISIDLVLILSGLWLTYPLRIGLLKQKEQPLSLEPAE
ncbi:MAG: PepSY-associated TM helix domain-containing protein [Pseudomonadota bacterium]